jgi:uncharacterized membrane protein
MGPVLCINLFGKKIILCMCHRKENRTFKIKNYVFPLCARCTGQFLGIIPAIILFFIYDFMLPLIISFMLMLPMLIDGITQTFMQRESKNSIRVITGFMFSLGLIYFLLWWLYV